MLPGRCGILNLLVPGKLYCTCPIPGTDRCWVQRWIYRIDPKRANEYGQVMGTDVDAAKAQEESKQKKKAE